MNQKMLSIAQRFAGIAYYFWHCNGFVVAQCAEEKSNESVEDMNGTFTGW